MSKEERKRMVSKEEKLSIRQQCVLLGLCRTSLYYTESEETAENLEIMRLLDRQYAITPFYGQRRLQAWLAEKGYPVNIKRLRRLMGLVRWRTLFPEHRTTVADKKAYKYPYLNPCETGDELWRGLDGYFRFYNGERLHQSLGYKTPASRYLLQKEAA